MRSKYSSDLLCGYLISVCYLCVKIVLHKVPDNCMIAFKIFLIILIKVYRLIILLLSCLLFNCIEINKYWYFVFLLTDYKKEGFSKFDFVFLFEDPTL